MELIVESKIWRTAKYYVLKIPRELSPMMDEIWRNGKKIIIKIEVPSNDEETA